MIIQKFNLFEIIYIYIYININIYISQSITTIEMRTYSDKLYVVVVVSLFLSLCVFTKRICNKIQHIYLCCLVFFSFLSHSLTR